MTSFSKVFFLVDDKYVDMYQESSDSIGIPILKHLGAVDSTMVGSGVLGLAVLSAATLASVLLAVKAWAIHKEIRHKRKSRRNPRRKVKLFFYVLSLIMLVITTELMMFSIIFS